MAKHLRNGGEMENTIELIRSQVIQGQHLAVPESVTKALDSGIPSADVLNGALISAMESVGKLFEAGQYFVPEMLLSARAMKAGLEILRPHLVHEGVRSVGTVVLGTVEGDLHDIGKNLVGMMLEGGGFEVVDLGSDVEPDIFVSAARTSGARIVGLSALLSTTMSNMLATIAAFERAGIRDQVKIIVGGAPVTQSFCDQIGADGYAPNASAAATLCSALINSAS